MMLVGRITAGFAIGLLSMSGKPTAKCVPFLNTPLSVMESARISVRVRES